MNAPNSPQPERSTAWARKLVRTRVELKILFRLQKFFSIILVVVMSLFPLYILHKDGWNVQPIYDRDYNIVGHANSFLLSLLFSIFGTGIGALSYWAAQKGLAGNGSNDSYRRAGRLYRRDKARKKKLAA